MVLLLPAIYLYLKPLRGKILASSDIKWVWRLLVFPTKNESELPKVLSRSYCKAWWSTWKKHCCKPWRQVNAFLDGTAEVAFQVPKTERHRGSSNAYSSGLDMPRIHGQTRVLLLHRTHDRSVTPAQLTWLVRQYRKVWEVYGPARCTKHGFTRRFTVMDVALLAEMDALHGTLSGPTIRSWWSARQALGNARFERLSGISVSHL